MIRTSNCPRCCSIKPKRSSTDARRWSVPFLGCHAPVATRHFLAVSGAPPQLLAGDFHCQQKLVLRSPPVQSTSGSVCSLLFPSLLLPASAIFRLCGLNSRLLA